jgi:hypothetical protein
MRDKWTEKRKVIEDGNMQTEILISPEKFSGTAEQKSL